MAKSLTPVNANADTFEVWVNRTNDLINALAVETVTVFSNSIGAQTAGNGFVTGILSAITLSANNIRGGNVQTTTLLTVSSNVNFATGNIVSVGNSTVNGILTETSFQLSNVPYNKGTGFNTHLLCSFYLFNLSRSRVVNVLILPYKVATGMGKPALVILRTHLSKSSLSLSFKI